MEEQLISFETAKLAKEKGFNEPVQNMYKDDTLQNSKMDMGGHPNNYNNCYSAPPQSFLQKWLREKHNLVIGIEGINDRIDIAFIKYYNWTISGYRYRASDNEYIKWEEGLEDALQEALKHI